MDKDSVHGSSVIGAGEVDRASSAVADKNTVYETNRSYWDTTGNDFLETIALPFYGAFVSEESCRLFEDVSGKKVLEIGCGDGESLQYQGKRKASELWGIDLSEKQLEKAARNLAARGLSAKLICSPMEEDCGIPTDYFDFVYSIYAIGWTADLEGTFRRIASYLKKDGVFIFSWSHPIHKCVATEEDRLIFKKCYFDESLYKVSFEEAPLILSDRKLSTYINALAEAGFVIERMIEQSDEDLMPESDSAFAEKAKMLPVTFVIKARKR